jgi:ABC-type lipoprotein export system ATPase subunit
LNQRRRLTILMFAHNRRIAASADRIVRLMEGRIVE